MKLFCIPGELPGGELLTVARGVVKKPARSPLIGFHSLAESVGCFDRLGLIDWTNVQIALLLQPITISAERLLILPDGRTAANFVLKIVGSAGVQFLV